MRPFFETLAVLGLIFAGWLLGRRCSRFKKTIWMLSYALALAVIILIGCTHRAVILSFTPPFSWVALGRREFAIGAFFSTLLFTALQPHLPIRRQRVLLGLFMVCLSVYCLLPFLAPGCLRSYLAGLKTRIDENGVCRQSNEYTCGPAAAVTALRKLGFEAEEGEIAILAHTSPFLGTPVDCLALALEERYGAAGLACEVRQFESPGELRTSGAVLAVLRFGLMVDHYAAILEVQDDGGVVIGDPLSGKRSLPADQFGGLWRKLGIVLSKKRL